MIKSPSPPPRAINTFDQLKLSGGGVGIVSVARDARGCVSSHWAILKVNRHGRVEETDPKAHWTMHGQKVFSYITREQRMEALERAKAWVAKTYHEPGPWVRNQLYDYVPRRVNNSYPLRRKEQGT